MVKPVQEVERRGTQHATLTAFDASVNDYFGFSVVLSGGTSLVGANGDNRAGGADAGSAYVFGIEVTPQTDAGSGLASVAGIVALVATGSLVVGMPLSMSLTITAPSALTILFLSVTRTPLPLKGGTLIPVPPLLVHSLATNESGEIAIPFAAWPPGASGLNLNFQYAIQDAGAVKGVALSTRYGPMFLVPCGPSNNAFCFPSDRTERRGHVAVQK